MLGAPGEGSLAGDGLAFLAALAFAVTIVITRWRRTVSMAPATCLSQVILIAVFLPFAQPGEIGGDDVVWLAALGIGQIGLGLALLTAGARLIPAAQVGLITLLEVVLGPVWVWLALDERPSTLTLAGGAVVIVAIVIQTSEAPAPSPTRTGRFRHPTSAPSGRRERPARVEHRGLDPLRDALRRVAHLRVQQRRARRGSRSRSGSPTRRIRGARPPSESASHTPVPKPPASTPSSTVTSRSCSAASWASSPVSSGLAKRASATVTSRPPSARRSAAPSACWTPVP